MLFHDVNSASHPEKNLKKIAKKPGEIAKKARKILPFGGREGSVGPPLHV